jgi:hypothetical protein
MTTPKVFISYSWSSPEHQDWVIDLAKELAGSGVQIVLDKWDLKEGHDSIAFMEKMVTDPAITKVILVCDKVYVTKADGRAGGVGTETQIISPEVYAKQDQNKFVAVIAEKDADGKPYRPTYYKSRIYIDLSESDRYAENFEQLVRWIFDKPLHVRPKLGKAPSYITEPNAVALGTSALARRAIDGLRNDKSYARGAVEEYFTSFGEQLERFRLPAAEGPIDDRIVQSIDDFLPARNEYIQVFSTLIQYGDVNNYSTRINRFFESLLPYQSRPESVRNWSEQEYDNFKFIVHELFLYGIALLVRADQLGVANKLLSQPYYIPGRSDHGTNATVSFFAFRAYMESLEQRNRRLQTDRVSLRADMLKSRSDNSGVEFRHLMQADFICYMRGLAEDKSDVLWWPESLPYAGRSHGAFELFARAASKAELPAVLTLLGTPSVEDLKQLVGTLDKNNLPRWTYNSFSPATLLNLEKLGTRP